MTWLYIAIGGALGSMARYFMQSAIGRYAGLDFPYGTLIVNITGSVLMGIFIGWLARVDQGHAQNLRLFVAIGVLGGYTTFSSFSLDAITLMEEGKLSAMAVYVLSSVVISVAGLYAGLRFIRLFG